jgi:membrane-bound lytic murein transglycosylase D
MVHQDVHLDQIAGVVGTDPDMLRSLNPAYRRDVVPGKAKTYPVRLPLADTGKFIDMEDSVYNFRASELLTKRSVVDVADDLPTFSRGKRGGYGRKSARSRRNRSARRGGRSRVSSSSSAGSSVTIRKGQTLSEIAKQNGTTVAKLRSLNGIKGNNIRAGKKLRVK